MRLLFNRPALHVFLLGALAATIGAAACSAGSTGSGSTFGSSESGGSTGNSGGSNGSGNGGTSFSTGNGGSGGSGGGHINPDAACGSSTEKAKGNPVDLYIAIDKSSSMAGDKWMGATDGLTAFVNDPASAGLDVALNFFPLDGMPTCDQHLYEPPVVAFATLPGNATHITNAMNATTPNGMYSPIYPALGGAILGAKAQVDSHPGDAAAVMLVTDGAPMGPSMVCGNVDPEDPANIAALAAAGVMYGVKTFVVGLPGVDEGIADQIAAAGGTTSAILVGSGDVENNFKAALAKVRGETLPCSFDIPAKVASGDVAVDEVNVLYTPGGSKGSILPENPNCSGGVGWKYDNVNDPKKIEFCPTSCTKLQGDYGAEVQILLGCATVVN